MVKRNLVRNSPKACKEKPVHCGRNWQTQRQKLLTLEIRDQNSKIPSRRTFSHSPVTFQARSCPLWGDPSVHQHSLSLDYLAAFMNGKDCICRCTHETHNSEIEGPCLFSVYYAEMKKMISCFKVSRGWSYYFEKWNLSKLSSEDQGHNGDPYLRGVHWCGVGRLDSPENGFGYHSYQLCYDLY